jgi:uncharacterized protein YcbK (DUF882 family)
VVRSHVLGVILATALSAQPVALAAVGKRGAPVSAGAPPAQAAARSPARRAAPARAKQPRPTSVSRFAPVELFHINRRETMRLRLYDARGRAVPGVQKRIERFLRCHHTNKQHRIDPRLVRLIYETGHGYPGRRVEVVSGYRHPSVASNPKSPHMKGLACDLRVAGVKNSELRDFLRKRFQRVGIGYYPNSAFVHLDVRKERSAFWIDYSGPGQAPVYAEKPLEDLKTGRAAAHRPGSALGLSPGSGADEGERDVPTPGAGAVELPAEPADVAGTPAPSPASSPSRVAIPGGGGPRAGN